MHTDTKLYWNEADINLPNKFHIIRVTVMYLEMDIAKILMNYRGVVERKLLTPDVIKETGEFHCVISAWV